MLRLDKLKATTHVVSIKAHKALENGNFVNLVGIDETAAYGVGEIFKTAAPVAKDRKVCLVSGVELMHDEQYGIADDKVAKDAIVRGIFLEKGDIITLTNDLVNSIIETPAVGAYVIVKEGNVAKYTDSVNGSETIVMEVIANTTLSGEKAVQLLVV